MMQLPVLIEPLLEGKGFVARLGDPFNLSETAGTAAEAFVQLQAAWKRRLDGGTQVAALLAPVPSLFPPSAGWLPEDELTREWRDNVKAIRRERDEADRLEDEGPSDDKVAS